MLKANCQILSQLKDLNQIKSISLLRLMLSLVRLSYRMKKMPLKKSQQCVSVSRFRQGAPCETNSTLLCRVQALKTKKIWELKVQLM